MDIFNPLSMPGRSDPWFPNKFLKTTKTEANSADSGLKYYFCARLGMRQVHLSDNQTNKLLIWQGIGHLR